MPQLGPELQRTRLTLPDGPSHAGHPVLRMAHGVALAGPTSSDVSARLPQRVPNPNPNPPHPPQLPLK